MLHDHTHKALAPGNSVYFIHESGFTDGWLIPIGLGWVALQLSWEQLIQPAGRGQLGAAPRDPHLPPWSGHWPGHCLLVVMAGAWESKQKNVSPSHDKTAGCKILLVFLLPHQKHGYSRRSILCSKNLMASFPDGPVV